MKYHGEVYVIDFDDTLFWAPAWYDEVELDHLGILIDPGDSISLAKAFSLLKGTSYQLGVQIDLNLKHFNIFFSVLKDLKPQYMHELFETFTAEELSKACIQGPSKFSDYAAVTNDHDYYKQFKSVGPYGPRKEVLDIYNSNKNVVILTARKDLPGMKEEILKKISEYTRLPNSIHLSPPKVKDNGAFKAEVIKSIAKQDTVTKVYFYDDNPHYIQSVKDMLNLNPNLKDKVVIVTITLEGKPNHIEQQLDFSLKVSNRMDEVGNFSIADKIDKVTAGKVDIIINGTLKESD